MLRRGLGIEKNGTLAHIYLEKAAANGVTEAYLDLGQLYVFGNGVDQNTEKALNYFEKAAEQKISKAYVWIGRLYSTSHRFSNKGGLILTHDPSKAFKHFEIAASLGNEEGLFYLARCYEFGQGVAVNNDQAFLNYKNVAEKGNALAWERLGACYEFGDLGVPKDIVQAVFCYKQAFDIYAKSDISPLIKLRLESLLKVNITKESEPCT